MEKKLLHKLESFFASLDLSCKVMVVVREGEPVPFLGGHLSLEKNGMVVFVEEAEK